MIESTIRYDILKEVFNVSVGKAAGMLSEIVNKKILLSIPDIEIVNKEKMEIQLDDFLPKQISGTLMVSSIAFKESFIGKANLIFPADKMRTFIQLCLNEEQTNCSDLNFTDIDFDIIKEVGNIILNCVIGETGNYLDMSFIYSLPEVKVYSQIDFDKDLKQKEYYHILILHITFMIDDIMIEGAIIVDLTLNSLKELLGKIDILEAKLYE